MNNQTTTQTRLVPGYRPAAGFRCSNGQLKVPAYLSDDQLEDINRYAALNGLSFKDGFSQIVTMGLGEV